MIFKLILYIWEYKDKQQRGHITYSQIKSSFELNTNTKHPNYLPGEYKDQLGSFTQTAWGKSQDVSKLSGKEFLDRIENNYYSYNTISTFHQWKVVLRTIKHQRCFVRVVSIDKEIEKVKIVHCPRDEALLLVLDSNEFIREVGAFILKDYDARPPRWMRKRSKKVKAE